MTNKTYKDVDNKINKLKKRIKKSNKITNDSGIWLFLATLGCWSVEDSISRLLAVIVCFVIFTHFFMKQNPFIMECIEKKKIKKYISCNIKSVEIRDSKLELLKSNLVEKIFVFLAILPYTLSVLFFIYSVYFWYAGFNNEVQQNFYRS